LLKNSKPSTKEVAGLIKVCVAGIGSDYLESATQMALQRFRNLGSTDKVAKGPELGRRLLEDLADKYPSLSAVAKAGKRAV
jgi:hypothetical protein